MFEFVLGIGWLFSRQGLAACLAGVLRQMETKTKQFQQQLISRFQLKHLKTLVHQVIHNANSEVSALTPF